MQRTLLSATLALALAALLAVFYYAGSYTPATSQVENTQKDKVEREFHKLDRLEIGPTPVIISGCLECHQSAPHVSDKRTRAFLNMHLRAFDCSVCHLSGKLTYLKLTKPDVEPPELLLTATLGGEKPQAVAVEFKEDTGKHLVDKPTAFAPKAISCKSCHRRGSTMLRALGSYEGHRKRLLEDLEILSILKGKK